MPLLYVPTWYILQAPVNLCACLIRSIWIVFAWKHLFSLSCKHDEKTKQTCTHTGKTPVNAPVHKQIPVGSFESTDSCWLPFNSCKHAVSWISIKVSLERKHYGGYYAVTQTTGATLTHLPPTLGATAQGRWITRTVDPGGSRHLLLSISRWHHVGLLMSALVDAREGSTWHLWWKIQPRPLRRRWQWEMSLECWAC